MNLEPVEYTPIPIGFVVACHSPAPVPGIAPRYQCPCIVTIRVPLGLGRNFNRKNVAHKIGVIDCTGKETQRDTIGVMAERVL